ncbi:hypothetical protein JIG36_51105 [Actinoplanes sp. LDG1-06]|uniref:Uncharacterized protein n=1 Tax=Paractinoplanes ovalisporus TaxID=2810368 RepID=A0ABS2AVU2_9ACTN|nr:hypothetical protein [Actinoplanes ovalisporus]MBM2623868.1 hypothetical protein [Actinoplanes ovalisporus]
MVRLIRRPGRNGGPPTWAEDAPGECPAGHPGPVPTWGAADCCGGMGRQWVCRAADCGRVMLDPDHEHAPPRPPIDDPRPPA